MSTVCPLYTGIRPQLSAPHVKSLPASTAMDVALEKDVDL
jgi:hypothetical protein